MNAGKVISIIAVITMAAGLFGMLFCFPFLWSGLLEDLVGAGFPFVGGAILFGAGLITLGMTQQRDKMLDRENFHVGEVSPNKLFNSSLEA